MHNQDKLCVHVEQKTDHVLDVWTERKAIIQNK